MRVSGAVILGIQMGLLAALQASPSVVHAQAQAHEHGVGHLNLAIEGQVLEVELMAPGADVVGFEHAATTLEQKAAIQKAVAKLKDGATLFRLPKAANCRLEEAEVESTQLEEDHHDEHGAGHKDHAEFHAHYHFDCADMGAVTHVEIGYFQAFPAARELEVQYITPRGQGAAKLDRANPRLKL